MHLIHLQDWIENTRICNFLNKKNLGFSDFLKFREHIYRIFFYMIAG